MPPKVLTYKAVDGFAPDYITSLLTRYNIHPYTWRLMEIHSKQCLPNVGNAHPSLEYLIQLALIQELRVPALYRF